MAFDERLASRIRAILRRRRGIEEKKMFGGLAFLAGGHMVCGVVKDELMVRVGPENYERVLEEPHVREMDFTGRPMRGMVYVGKKGIATEEALRGWIERGLAHARSLQSK